MVMDMRQAVFSRSPFSYRVGTSAFNVQTKFVAFVTILGALALCTLYMLLPVSRVGDSNLTSDIWGHGEDHGHEHSRNWFGFYNGTYPLTPAIYSDRGFMKYRIAIITDLDQNSLHPTEKHTWISYLKKGYLTINVESEEVKVDWDDNLIPLKSSLGYDGRGMELSELIVFNGKLYAVDDRTGIVFEIDLMENRAIPWVVLNDGNGRESKGFKSEWATVKDETLIVGGVGKEWTDGQGRLVNNNPQWVKTVSGYGHVEHHDWTSNYDQLKKAVGISSPGYMMHESCAWTEKLQRWVFLPRRLSKEKYSELDDEKRGANVMLLASEGFEKVQFDYVGEKIDTHGFSSFKFVPGTQDRVIVALKSEEVEGNVASYITAFNLDRKILLPETKIGDYKFEGIEFV